MLAAAASGDPEALRSAAREWIERNVPAEWLAAALAGDMDRLHAVRSPEAYREWYPPLGRSGLTVPTWPVEYGGLGLSRSQSGVVAAELRRARLTTLNVVGIGLVAPTLLQYGSEYQKQTLLGPIVDNTAKWCQLFSEPGAGSDLAGLSTKAERVDADTWRIDGQKVWSSFAHEADYGILLARTDPSLPKHQGITVFAFPMRHESVTVRPLRKISGDHEFNEVFINDAVVDDRLRIGEQGQGWEIARAVLAFERAMLSGAGSGLRERTSGSSIQTLVTAAKAAGAVDDPVMADEVVRLYVENQVVQLTNARARSLGREGAAPGQLKVLASEHNQRLQAALLDLTGAVVYDPEDASAARRAFGFLRSRGDTIGGGTSEVQRNNVAERVLGLPKDPFSDNTIPWRDIKRGPTA
ncbi:acyl-CoA dehydrogenase [Pseudonocardia halophobica]|uniref:Acyl-CoA dehydrogenase n=1 Tax=Pseudonocardia halophobica TaxID=29401 RepID=A0A9W6KYQ5_9PSEU|nr:acyl-CoA dehydrogenase [Pseudonocardia halophobica]